jgi:hypothetical protein
MATAVILGAIAAAHRRHCGRDDPTSTSDAGDADVHRENSAANVSIA